MEKIDDFEELLTKSTRLFQVFGLQFFTLNNLRSSKDAAPRFSLLFKISLLVNILYHIATIVLIITFDLLDNNIKQGKAFQIGSAVILIIFVVHSLLTTEKLKSIFILSYKAGQIFEKSLKVDNEIHEFCNKFQKVIMKFKVIIVVLWVTATVQIYLNKQPLFLLAAFIQQFAGFQITVSVIRFVFFVRLVDHNLVLMKLSVQRMTFDSRVQRELINRSPFKRIVKFTKHNHLSSLKQIYSVILEMADLINDVSGPILMYCLILTIFVSSVNGLKLYYITQSDLPVEAAIGKF